MSVSLISFLRVFPPRSPRLCGYALLIALTTALAFAQTAAEKPSVDVRRVGFRLACQCGCKDSVATCAMLECGFSNPAKERIAKMQAASIRDQQIIDGFIHDYGAGIYLSPPSAFGWLVPYFLAIAGFGVLAWFVNRYRKPKPLTEVGPIAIDDPALAKYKDQIEKELSDLE
jgi:cytochrome c-type biogenesis protein CcmH